VALSTLVEVADNSGTSALLLYHSLH